MRGDILESEPLGLLKLDIVDVKYALFLCLQYICETEEVMEMLVYVLLCSSVLAKYMDARGKIFDIIDCMAELIGKDYKVEGRHTPMEVFGLLEKDVRRVLFENMTKPAKAEDDYEVIFAKKQLAKQLSKLSSGREAIFAETEDYLRQSGRYFQKRFSEIILIIDLICSSAKNTKLN
jgi:hypothetical protein